MMRNSAYQNERWTLESTTFDFEKGLNFRTREREMDLYFKYRYKIKVRDSILDREIPVLFSDKDHIHLRTLERCNISDDQFKSLLVRSVRHILQENQMSPNGYLITSDNLGITVPLFVFKNTDINSIVSRFVEIKTVLKKGYLGTDCFAVYSDAGKKIRYILPKAVSVAIDNI